ncbi:HYC_CC_PP family protein [Yeosuana sp. AK3]
MIVLSQKIMAFLMALVVLFSTMSFTIDRHYCGNTLVDTAVFNKAKGCGMEMQVSTINSECSTVKKSCCTEEQITVQGQDELQLTFYNLTFEKQLIVASFTYAYLNLFEGLPQQVIPYKNYTPPLIVKDIPVLNDTFLI